MEVEEEVAALVVDIEEVAALVVDIEEVTNRTTDSLSQHTTMLLQARWLEANLTTQHSGKITIKQWGWPRKQSLYNSRVLLEPHLGLPSKPVTIAHNGLNITAPLGRTMRLMPLNIR